jgi:hypothetical protein
LGYHFNPARMMMAINNLSQTSFIKENWLHRNFYWNTILESN